jgi:hypothetical protein
MSSLGEKFRFVQPGDPITAEAWNDLLRRANVISNVGDDLDVMYTGIGVFRGGTKRQRRSGTTGQSEPGTFTDCSCGGCLEAGSIDACAAAGEAPQDFVLSLASASAAIRDAFGASVVLTHDSSCTWLSDTFEDVDLGDGDHDYFFKLVFSGTSIEEATLTLEDET